LTKKWLGCISGDFFKNSSGHPGRDVGSFPGRHAIVLRVARFFFVENVPKREKYTKLPQIMPNGQKLYQMAVNYSEYQHFSFQGPPKVTQIGIFGMKKTIWQP
jgi:hypothetical protein